MHYAPRSGGERKTQLHKKFNEIIAFIPITVRGKRTFIIKGAAFSPNFNIAIFLTTGMNTLYLQPMAGNRERFFYLFVKLL